MASATMPPPPSLLAHRRTKPSHSTAGTSVTLPDFRSMLKADSFHQSSSPPAADDPVLSIHHLPPRSTTCGRSSFASWLYGQRGAAAESVADFEQTFSGARGPRSGTRRQSQKAFQELLSTKQQQRALSPVDSGLGSSIGSPSEKSLSRALDKALELSSVRDSAVGNSLAGSTRTPSETLVQETNSNISTHNRRSSTHELEIIRYPVPPRNSSAPFLDGDARRKIYRSVFSPLLKDSRFEEFQGIVAGTRKNKTLQCLRDIEQALIKQPVTLSVTASKYKSFGELTIQLVIDAHQQLSENEQRRSTDRAYDNGYFLDLVQQVQQLAAHIGSSDTTIETGEQPTIDDEITLEGGLAESGNLAELVRWKDGQGTSLRTGLPYVPLAGIKRTASAMADDAQLSARRKKGVIYPQDHLPCSEPGCDKVFSRQCDLGKHEKTHSRPFKCPEPTCKFHEIGLPTEKELDRHRNDKHNSAPKMFPCKFCEFTTKRESNCKQHMEKKHDWTYKRSKGRDKASAMTPKSTPKTPAAGYSGEPSPASDVQSVVSFQSPFQPTQNSFGGNEYSAALFPRTEAPRMNQSFNFNDPIDLPGPSSAGGNLFGQVIDGNYGNGYQNYPTPASGVMHSFHTPKTPAYSNITESPMMPMDHTVPVYNSGMNEVLTPESLQAHSRQVSSGFQQDMQFMAHDPMFSAGMGDMDFDYDKTMSNDFQVVDSNVFTHEGAGQATLFPDVNTFGGEQEYSAEQFNIPDDVFPQGDEDSFFTGF